MLTLAGAQAAHAVTYSLEIIQPRAGLDTRNRYYKAYPGLKYDVQVSAIGGVYPYKFALTSAPSGMAIDPDSGVVTWSSPAASGSPYQVSVRVTDSNGASVAVQWPITVTTQGFKFVDAVNGRAASQGGDGSASNPWKTIADWYVSKGNSSYSGNFLYFRRGTYYTNAAPIEDGSRLALVPNQPLVWLAYPGDAPVIDTTGSYVCPYGGGSNAYFEGLSFQNFSKSFGVRIDSDADNVVFRRNKFSNLASGWGGQGTNASALMIARGSRMGTNWSVIDNTFQGIHDIGYGLLGYSTQKTLVQGNRCQDFTVSESKCIGPKENTQLWFIRDNRIDMAAGQGIWVMASTYTKDIEISYNLVQVDSGYALWVGQAAVDYGAVTSLRNTYVGAAVSIDNLTSNRGPVAMSNDVIVNNGGSGGLISSILSLVTRTNLLTGSLSSGIIDSAGNLTGSYLGYVGTRGYQRTAATTTRPNPPDSVAVQ